MAAIARMEHSSAAAYIEGLVERDLQAREEASRVIQIHVAAGLPDRPTGKVTRAEGEALADYEARSSLLDSLFGACCESALRDP